MRERLIIRSFGLERLKRTGLALLDTNPVHFDFLFRFLTVEFLLQGSSEI